MNTGARSVALFFVLTSRTWLKPVEILGSVMSTLVGMAVRSGCEYAARRRRERLEWAEAGKKPYNALENNKLRCTGCVGCDTTFKRIYAAHLMDQKGLKILQSSGGVRTTLVSLPPTQTMVRYTSNDKDCEELLCEEAPEKQLTMAEEEEMCKKQESIFFPFVQSSSFILPPFSPIQQARSPTPFSFDRVIEEALEEASSLDDGSAWDKIDFEED